MSEMALDLIRRAKAEGWKQLDLGNTGIVGEVPAEIWELEELEELILSDEWYEWIDGKYVFRKSSNTGSQNKISSFPAHPILPFSQEDIPQPLAASAAEKNVIPCLGSLKKLVLSSTQVADIQPLAQLTQLTRLYLSHTQVADIQPLAQIAKLTTLYLSSTQVADIQPLAQLAQLTTLDLSFTQVADIQPLKALIEKGLELAIRGCPLTNPPYEIAIQGNQAILNYWRDRDEEKAIPATELKIFLLGNTSAGKSTLAYVLDKQMFPKEMRSTYGAQIDQTWNLGGKEIHIWDFGGQEYFHATHQLLVNDNAIYLVVVDPLTNSDGFLEVEIWHLGDPAPRKEKLELFHYRYWLEMVHNNAPRAKVLLFWNKLFDRDKCDLTRMKDEDHEMFKDFASMRSFPNDIFLAINEGIPFWVRKWEDFYQDLVEAVDHHLKNREVLSFWPQIRNRISYLSQDKLRITKKEFDQICLDGNPKRDIPNIITYLRDMVGRVLYWEHSGLEGHVYIHPSNLNYLIYSILSRKVIEQNGWFSFGQAVIQVIAGYEKVRGNGQLNHKEIRDLTTDLLQIMKEFKLIFEASRDAREYVAPQYLPSEQPETVGAALEFVSFESCIYIRFKQYIPRHIVPHFIAAKGLFAVQQNYWKYGIIYKEDGVTTTLWVDYTTRTISAYSAAPHSNDPNKHPLFLMFEKVKMLIGGKMDFEVSTDKNCWVNHSELMHAINAQARRVKAINGTYLERGDFRTIFAEIEWAGTIPPPMRIITNVDIFEELSSIRSTVESLQAENRGYHTVNMAAHTQTHVRIEVLDAQLNRTLTKIKSLQGQSNQLHNDLQTIFRRINDNAQLSEGLLQHLLTRQSEIDLAIQQGLAALPKLERPTIEAPPPPAPNASKWEKLAFVKLKLSMVTLVAAALAATPAAPIALPALLAASAIDAETTLPAALQGIWKLLCKIAEPFRMDQR